MVSKTSNSSGRFANTWVYEIGTTLCNYANVQCLINFCKQALPQAKQAVQFRATNCFRIRHKCIAGGVRGTFAALLMTVGTVRS